MLSKEKRNRTLCAPLLAAGIVLAAAPAHACYTVHVDNQSTKDIYTVWSADGCAGIDHWDFLACNQAKVSAGGSKSYNYKWGVTDPSIFLFQELTLKDKPKRQVNYAYDRGKFKLDDGNLKDKASPGGCGGSYTITFTEDLRTKWLD
ncbi:MAG: hypothetical protein AAFX54_03110 [Pseudomonadota bacterium]